MNPAVLGALLDMGRTFVDRMFPDKVKQAAERAEAEQRVREWALEAEQYMTEKLQVSDSNQIEVNKIEAASDDKFKSRWRPAAGWVCVAGLAYQLLLWPLLSWTTGLMVAFSEPGTVIPAPPQLDGPTLMSLISGLLGLTVYRSYEKKSGVA